MSVNSYATVRARWPKDTKLFDKSYFWIGNLHENNGFVEYEEEGDGAYLYSLLHGYVELFGKPLDKVRGLELHAWYECSDDGYYECTLEIKDGKCRFEESEIRMVERPMSSCPIEIG